MQSREKRLPSAACYRKLRALGDLRGKCLCFPANTSSPGGPQAREKLTGVKLFSLN